MRVMVFPVAFMANTFAMMVVMIGLSLFGRPELAADFGLVHGATVALFYSFSGNARSLILGESGRVDGAAILRLRLLLLLPLAILAFALCIGVVGGGWLFVLLLVVRRAVEWLAEVFLSEQELQHQGKAALRFLLIQGVLSLALLLALLDDGVWALSLTLAWALSPLLGCISLALLGRALGHAVPVMAGIRQMLPHFGSTAVIGVSVYVFRLFILLVAGKETAGDLFSAFALGGILGAVFSQALGPTMVRQERSAAGPGRMLQLFNLMLVLVALAGGFLLAIVWSVPHLLDWTQKSQLFWLAVGCSLVGGVVMVLAQRIRLRILQDEVGGDVFGSDMLANILLLACIPFLFYWLGVDSLAVLYLLGAALSFMFYMSEQGGLMKMFSLNSLSESRILLMLVVALILPVFFQLNGGVFNSTDTHLTSGGNLLWLPLPFSIFFCYLGVVFLGGYSQARMVLVVLFFLFVGMLLSCLLGGVGDSDGGGKLILLIQYILPISAIVLGYQFGFRSRALEVVAKAGVFVLLVVVPLQLFSTLRMGSGYLSPSAAFFSIYQHLQYVPVIFVGIFWVCVFSLWERIELRAMLVGMALIFGAYTMLSHSMLAIVFMFIAGIGFVSRFLSVQSFWWVFSLCMALILGGVLGWFEAAGKSLFSQKFSASEDGVPVNFMERTEFWRFYLERIWDDGRDFVFGHSSPPDRDVYPSAHNYYLDFIFNFGLLGVSPLLALLMFTIFRVIRSFGMLWVRPEILGLAGVALFFLIVDNSLKVGLRQPYSGIIMFFFWGLLLAQLHLLRMKRV